MSKLSEKELKLYASNILKDYDEKNPGIILKDPLRTQPSRAKKNL